MTEMIPTPLEKREAVVRDHVILLLENLQGRIGRLERAFFLSTAEAREFELVIEQIRREEKQVEAIHADGSAAAEDDRVSLRAAE